LGGPFLAHRSAAREQRAPNAPTLGDGTARLLRPHIDVRRVAGSADRREIGTTRALSRRRSK
jgi:hypothetical protein